MAVWLFVTATCASLAWLVVRAAADAWRYPALVPQRLGTRGIDVALDNSLVSAFGNSLFIAIIASLISLVLVLPALAVLSRRGLIVRAAAVLALVLPAAMPGNVVGLGLATLTTRWGLDGSAWAVVLSHLPFVIGWQAVTLIAAWDPALREREDAAVVLGLAPLRSLVHVTVPGLRRPAAAAAAIGFLVSWGQYATTLLVGGGIDTLPVRIVPFVASDPQVAAVMTLVFVAPAIIVGVVAIGSPRMEER